MAIKPLSINKSLIPQVIVAVFEEGTMEIYDLSGAILYKHILGFSTKLIATTQNFDDLKIAVITPDHKLQIYTVKIEKPKTSSSATSEKLFVELKKDYETDTYSEPTSMIHYVRSGHKNWAIGDNLGGVSLHHLNGTWVKRSESLNSPITSLDRLGSQLVFASGNSIGVLNTNSMSLSQYCEGVITI